MTRLLAMTGALFAFGGVALGAFGAHGLKRALTDVPDALDRLAWWKTGVEYHFVHALAFFALAWLSTRVSSKAVTVAAVAFALGIVLFAGSLYTMGATGVRVLGAVTPFGGVSFLVGWIATFVAAARMNERGS